MLNVSIDEDCSNAPKKQYIKDFLIKSAAGDINSSIKMLSEDIELHFPGRTSVRGTQAVTQILKEDAARSNVTELRVSNILSHGNRCAADGIFIFEDGGEVAFCNIYVFNSHAADAKIKSMTIYSTILK